jgi:hypothetical protein
VPAPQDGRTPADYAARYNGNAEVKAFFARGQVRPIRVQSEGTRRPSEGTQRALGGHQGHSVAIRGLSEASQRHAERPSEAIRGHSEALTGHQRALRGHPWPSFAISSTQAHSVAIKRAPGPKTATMATSHAERAPCVCACACSQHLKPAKAAPTTLATTRFMESYNQPERKPDQLYAQMTTDCHRLPERRAARYSRIGSSK